MWQRAMTLGGGGSKTSSGNFSTQQQVLKTITIPEMSNIDTVTWRMPNYPDNYGYAKKYDSPYSDIVSMSYSGSGLYPSTIGVQSISGNTFTFNWGGNQDFEYTVFGT